MSDPEVVPKGRPSFRKGRIERIINIDIDLGSFLVIFLQSSKIYKKNSYVNRTHIIKLNVYQIFKKR